MIDKAYEELVELHPTPEEIQGFADLHKKDYGVVTYSFYKGGDYYFIRYHDKYRQTFGGKVHIDIGYVDPTNIHNKRIPDITHLMLDQYLAPKFIEYIKNMRKTK
jgi:hypothetical protein